ncbi:acyl-CoA carboxylase subunit epsilon [Streptomyces javensis]|uniref:acyl-CoA carboxylase subunit epsilon n=1 Tax=Streptomyces javensis TaxID=114698 RepID=UPI0031F94A0D
MADVPNRRAVVRATAGVVLTGALAAPATASTASTAPPGHVTNASPGDPPARWARWWPSGQEAE